MINTISVNQEKNSCGRKTKKKISEKKNGVNGVNGVKRVPLPRRQAQILHLFGFLVWCKWCKKCYSLLCSMYILW